MNHLNQLFKDEVLIFLYQVSRLFLFLKYSIDAIFMQIDAVRSVYGPFTSKAFTVSKIKKSFTQGVVV